MGCDIHMHVEYKNERFTGEDTWQNGDYFTMSKPGKYSLVEFCGDRNYGLFAILADVRNYNYVNCISEPRGIPDDATDYVKADYGLWEIDAHSASYFTLKELIDFYVADGAEELEHLIDELKRRADELDVIYGFTWEGNYTRAYDLSDNIRIVFWFDN